MPGKVKQPTCRSASPGRWIMHSAALKINLFLGSSCHLISHRCLELRQHRPLGPKKNKKQKKNAKPLRPQCSWMCRGKPLIEATSKTIACFCDIFSSSFISPVCLSVQSLDSSFLEFTAARSTLCTWNAAATSWKALGRSDWSETLMDGGVWFASCYL